MNSEKRERRLAKLSKGEAEVQEVELAAPKKRSESVVVSVRVPAEVADTLAKWAEVEDKATGTLARELIENGLAREPGASIELMSTVLARLVSRFESTGHFATSVAHREVSDITMMTSGKVIHFIEPKATGKWSEDRSEAKSQTAYAFFESGSPRATRVKFGGTR